MQGFMTFIREQGVIGLAVGLAIGAAAGETVKAVVDGLINPIVGFILGGTDLTELSWSIVEGAERNLTIGYGAVLNSLITLLAVAFVIYYVVKKMGLDKLDAETEE